MIFKVRAPAAVRGADMEANGLRRGMGWRCHRVDRPRFGATRMQKGGNMNAAWLRRVLPALVVAVCTPCATQAQPVTLNFTGTVVQTPYFDQGNPFSGLIDVGTPFSGRYTFDSAAADSVPDSATGSYAAIGAPHALSVSFGSPWIFGVDFADLAIGIGDGFGGTDFYTLATAAVPPGEGLAVSMILIDDDGNVFSSDALPAGAPALSEFESSQFMLFGTYFDSSSAPTQIEILGTIDSLACGAGCAIPEPSSVLLLTVGMAALAWRCRRSVSKLDAATRPNAKED